MNPQQLLSRFQSVRKSGSSWSVRCPAHKDDRASLSISQGADGRILLHCFAGCEPEAIMSALGLGLTDLFADKPAPPKPGIAATYDYRDETGALIFQTVRKIPKDFRQRRPDGRGGWIWDMGRVRRVPYRLPELQGQPVVWIVEGEKDADALAALGLPATTNACGATHWGATETKALKAAGVQRAIILPDNDTPGLKHAEAVAGMLRGLQIAVSVVQLPDLPPKGDVSNWLAAGHTRDELEALANAVPYIVPKDAGVVVPVAAEEPEIDPASDPSRYHLSDLGAAEAFRDRYGDVLRYDHRREEWLIWEGHYWRPDADAQAHRLAHEHIRAWQSEAIALPSNHRGREPLAQFTMRLERRGQLENFMALARTLKPISTAGDDWDTDNWLLGCPNGVIDLRTGDLRDGRPDDHITQQMGTSYEPYAACPRWMRFLDEVFDGDAELVEYTHKALGYALTGDMREQCFFLALGTGANGKSIFLDTLETVWGTYGRRANMRTFVSLGGDGEKFQLAELQGRRLVFASETKQGTRMNEHVLKNITGGESQSAERKYGHPFTFTPACKIWLGVNHQPKVADDSFGFWRRVRLIPFPRTFQGSAEDRGLKDRLREEVAGILAWAVRGCLKWQAEGLNAPASVLSATEAYQEEEDPLSDFLSEQTVTDADGQVGFASLYETYTKWAERQGLKGKEVLSAKAVGNNMKRRFTAVQVANSRRYLGLRLSAPPKDLLN